MDSHPRASPQQQLDQSLLAGLLCPQSFIPSVLSRLVRRERGAWGDEVESIEVDVSGVHSSVGVGLHSSVRTLFYFRLVSGFCCGCG